MFYIVSKLLAFLSKPIIWIFLLIIYLVFNQKNKKIIYYILFTFYIFTNSFIVDFFSKIWETPRYHPTEIYDIGIVLGGIGEFDKNTQANNFNKYADRIIDAKQLYHQGIIKKIMISGGNGVLFNDGYVEANNLRDYLIKNKIPPQDILIENTSRNTRENANNSAMILKADYPNGKFLLITSAQHMRRAQFCFNQTKIKTTAFPTDCTNSKINYNIEYMFLPKADALEKWEMLIHEWIGYIVYKITF